MFKYFNLFGVEFYAELGEGRSRFSYSTRHPKTLELWVGKLYLTACLA